MRVRKDREVQVSGKLKMTGNYRYECIERSRYEVD